MGTSWFTTRVTLSTSKPLESTSVAIIVLVVPSMNSLMTRSLSCGCMSPVMLVHLWPSPASCECSFLAESLVLTKIMVCPRSPSSKMTLMTAALASLVGTGTRYCLIRSIFRSTAFRKIWLAFGILLTANSLTSSLKVAENRIFWHSRFFFSLFLSISFNRVMLKSLKPLESISSASSKTTQRMWSKLIFLLLTKSAIRPGVPIRI